MIWDVHPGSESGFFPIPDPNQDFFPSRIQVSKKVPDPGSGFAALHLNPHELCLLFKFFRLVTWQRSSRTSPQPSYRPRTSWQLKLPSSRYRTVSLAFLTYHRFYDISFFLGKNFILFHRVIFFYILRLVQLDKQKRSTDYLYKKLQSTVCNILIWNSRGKTCSRPEEASWLAISHEHEAPPVFLFWAHVPRVWIDVFLFDHKSFHRRMSPSLVC